jgi:hypothetical protein
VCIFLLPRACPTVDLLLPIPNQSACLPGVETHTHPIHAVDPQVHFNGGSTQGWTLLLPLEAEPPASRLTAAAKPPVFSTAPPARRA